MINTVTGPIKKEDIGPTLSHEHLAWDSSNSWNLYFERSYNEVTLNKLYNILLPVFKELYELGCRTIVEASPPRGGQNLMLMYKLSIATGINIIPNTGLPFTKYFYNVHKSFDINELASQWINDYENGLDTIEDVLIRPAQIKLLLGDEGDGKLTETDEKLLKAALIASEKTKMPIHCHLLEATKADYVIDLLETEKFNMNKFLWAHAGNEGNFEVMEKAFNKGMWLGIDQIRPSDYPKYLKLLKEAIKRGYKNKLLLSQDYDFLEEFKDANIINTTKFFTQFIDYCDNFGLSKDIIMEIITKNPAKFLNIE